jgi:hypothetical protein
MYYERSRKDIFIQEFLPTIPIGGEFTTAEAFDWFQRDYPLFKKSGIEWLLKYLSDKRPKILDGYPLVLKVLTSTAWKRVG